MKSILILGMGKFGMHMAMKLAELDTEVMVVDKDEERLQEILPYVTSAQIGNSTREDFLRSLGINNFDTCVVAIGGDFQSSLETTLLLKELGAKHVISRAYSEIQSKILLRNGADQIVYPEKQLGEWTAITVGLNNVFDYFAVDKDLGVFEVKIPQKWVGKSIFELDIRKKYGINILGIKRNEEIQLTITPDIAFEEDDTI
ncbi:MAG: TrkA family potassium uptake protein, partial [Lachnospiraceae bacterium]|nr:TrkA family potassium uptake protein [Lachnospiraceae bacterium]